MKTVAGIAFLLLCTLASVARTGSPAMAQKADRPAGDGAVVARGEYLANKVAMCVQCHSPRLAFTQPKFPAKKWAEIVAKMANAYKAPLSADEQKKIVAYLSSVHGE